MGEWTVEYTNAANEHLHNIVVRSIDEADSNVQLQLWPKILLAFIFTVLILLALVGNILVCVAIFYDRRLREQTENLFLVSLAVSDMLVSVLVMAFAAVNDIQNEWYFGETYCKLWISFDITCCTASILNLCAISLDRYWHISQPMVYVRYVNRRRTSYAIIVVWLVSAGLGCMQIVFSNKNDEPTKCSLEQTTEFAVISSTMSFFIPTAVMVFLYTKLYLYAREHVRSIRMQLRAVTGMLLVHSASISGPAMPTPNSCAQSPMFDGEPMTRQKAKKLMKKQAKRATHEADVSDQKARITLGVIMGTFLVCWLPFFIVNVVRNFVAIHVTIFQTLTWLGYCNSSANPIIYSIFNKDFRRAFHRILLYVVEFLQCDVVVAFCQKCRHTRHKPRGQGTTSAELLDNTGVNQAASAGNGGSHVGNNNDLHKSILMHRNRAESGTYGGESDYMNDDSGIHPPPPSRGSSGPGVHLQSQRVLCTSEITLHTTGLPTKQLSIDDSAQTYTIADSATTQQRLYNKHDLTSIDELANNNMSSPLSTVVTVTDLSTVTTTVTDTTPMINGRKNSKYKPVQMVATV